MTDFPTSIRELNGLPVEEKEKLYSTLIPDWVFANYQIDPQTFMANGQRVVRFRHPTGSRAVEISVLKNADDMDPILYLNMVDTFNHQLLVLLVVVNDPDAPRFNIDTDPQGNNTHLGTTGRNIAAEKAAMAAGLMPGQIRQGLRVFRSAVPQFEAFVERMGHDLFLIEPLAYHNAIVFERYGFNYVSGFKEMQRIHQEFQPGGDYHAKLTPDNPFRQPDAWKTIGGRSWAIHDGIMGHPFTGFQMYKRIGKHAGINSFPDSKW